jgi:hypothetical protein
MSRSQLPFFLFPVRVSRNIRDVDDFHLGQWGWNKFTATHSTPVIYFSICHRGPLVWFQIHQTLPLMRHYYAVHVKKKCFEWDSKQ